MRISKWLRHVSIPLFLAPAVLLSCRGGGTEPRTEAASVGGTEPRTGAASAVTPPRVSAQLAGRVEQVFDTRDACEQIDIPDAFPRAFRDNHGRIHLIATHYVARAMVGATLDTVKRDCRVLYRSPNDPDPAHFLDENWLTSLYTEDGLRVAALAHTEYHGDEHPGMCGDLTNPRHAQDCAWTTITYAESRDGGNSFREPPPPGNLVASLPYIYDKNNRSGAQGYDSPTNILKLGSFYYSLVNVWREYRDQRYGPCLIRTSDVFDPSSWRGWDGTAFSVQFIDPYLNGLDLHSPDLHGPDLHGPDLHGPDLHGLDLHGPDPHGPADAERHVCSPIVEGTIDSLAIDARTGIIVGDVYVEDNRYGQGPGLYVLASRDLIHWSRPSLVVRTAQLLGGDGGGNYSYLYFALLDPASTDRNFATLSDTPYVYYVRLDDDHPPYKRVLLRRRIQIAFAA